ncbi:MAG TPA: hypothetical protein VFE91_03705, partial [Nitrososphaerales archaeon]|nr:hypothetical protein [Nitrososphaerales archaeon]
MRNRDAVVVILLVGLFAAAAASLALEAGPPTQTKTTTGANSGPVVFLQQLIAGEYPSAVDKNGTLGTTVTVLGLRVLYVQNETDGDWHVAVTDGRVPVFITEITPLYQHALGRPTAGSLIDETGRAFCDVQHENESWHGSTCWEVHPITAWRISSGTEGGQVSNGATPSLAVSLGVDEMLRGTNETIVVTPLGISNLSGLNATIVVSFPPGDSRRFSCTISPGGSCAVTVPITQTS